MSSSRLYLTRSATVERALAVAPKVRPDVGEKAPATKRLEALLDYAVEHWEAENARNERLLAYEELAALPGRRDRIKRNARAAAKRGLF
ncbi:MAG: hypothetical protein H0W90_13885 [Actinobacteria bacterium]|nr:hypothetical protein [Actinomycetota bacterium]